MVAAMNGMAVHGGIIPYGGTFLVFADYCRPALRLAALMRQRVIFVATHDSIGLGEDGPTHQPVEQLASLRAIPNMLVFRPADAVETAECWELALRQSDGPSALALTRQELPTLRDRAHRREPVRPRRLLLPRERRAARRHHPRHRLRGASGAGGARAAGRRRASRPPWCRCPAGSCSSARTRPIGRPCWAPPRAWRSRPPRRSAGRAMSPARPTWSACAASAPAGRSSSCTSISASRPSTSPNGRARCWLLGRSRRGAQHVTAK